MTLIRQTLGTSMTVSKAIRASLYKNPRIQRAFSRSPIGQQSGQATISLDEVRSLYGDAAVHSDLRLDSLLSRRFLTRDQLSADSSLLLDGSLNGHLPADVGHATSQELTIHLGNHQAYFRPRLIPELLLEDGTDTKFLPGPASIWKHRLWAGGSVSYNRETPLIADGTRTWWQRESVEDVRVVGRDAPKKVFVKVLKEIVAQPVNDDSESYDMGDFSNAVPLMTEIYTLCFLRESLTAPTDRPPAKSVSRPLFSHTMIPDSHLLFQFSALTYNAHKIHFDPSYAQKEYGLRGPVVHGPLTQVLMLQFVRRSLASLTKSENSILPFPKLMNYSNLRPLYVNEPIILCCAPSKAQQDLPPEQVDEWQVWIQTGQGEHVSPAVTGNIKLVLPETSSDREGV